MNPCPCGYLGHYTGALPLHARPDRALPLAHLRAAARPHRPPDRSARGAHGALSQRAPGEASDGDPGARGTRASTQIARQGKQQRAARRAEIDAALHAGSRQARRCSASGVEARAFGAWLSPRAEGRAHDRGPCPVQRSRCGACGGGDSLSHARPCAVRSVKSEKCPAPKGRSTFPEMSTWPRLSSPAAPPATRDRRKQRRCKEGRDRRFGHHVAEALPECNDVSGLDE